MRSEYSHSGRVAKIIFDDPNGNVFSRPFIDDLIRLTETAEQSDCQIIEFQSANRAYFSKGPDLAALTSLNENTAVMFLDEMATKLNRFIMRLKNSKKLIVMVLDGAAFGGGLNVFLASDVRLISKRGKVLENFSSYGLSLDLSASFFLPLYIGLVNTQKLLTEPTLLTGEQLTQMNLFYKCAPNKEALQSEVQRIEAFDDQQIATIKNSNALLFKNTGSLQRQLTDEKRFMLTSFKNRGEISGSN